MVTAAVVNPRDRLPPPVRVPSELFCQFADDLRSEVNLFFNEIRAAATQEDSECPDGYLAVEELSTLDGDSRPKKRNKFTKEITHAPKKTPGQAANVPTSTASTSSGNTASTAQAPSTSGASGSGAGAGAGGGEPPRGGSGAGKKKPDDGSPGPRRRKSRRLNPGLAEEEDDTTVANVAATSQEDNETLATVQPAPKRSRKKAAPSPPAPAYQGAPLAPAPASTGGSNASGSAAATASTTPPSASQGAPPASAPASTAGTSSGGITAAAAAGTSASAGGAAAGGTAGATPPMVIQAFTCGPQCRCNTYTRTQLREQLACNVTEHCRENLNYLRYLSLKHELTEIKNELKDTRQQVTNVELESKDILQASQEAADVRASENEVLSDEDKLDLKWESMDDGAEIFGEPEKKKALFRVLRKLPQEVTHFPRSIMRALFVKDLQERVYPEEKPATHANVSHVFILGELYHVLPQILHDFLCNYMANHVVGTATFERAKTKIEKYFNERRKQAKIKRKNKFIGKLTDPVHLLVWRDTWSKAYVIQEEPPLRGTDEAKEAFMDRWQEAVDARINFKHPQGFTHPPAE